MADAAHYTRPKIWQYMQFSLRSFLIIMLVAGAVGALCYHGLRIGLEFAIDEEHQWAYRRTQDFFRNGYSSRSGKRLTAYHEMAAEWHDQYVGHRMVHRNAVELAMRGAARLPVGVEKELPRMEASRESGDQLASYQITAPDGSMTKYVYLFRNDIVVFSAMREPADLNWVERSMSKETYYLAELSTKLQGILVFVTMIVTLMFGAALVIARGCLRYAWHRWVAPANAPVPPSFTQDEALRA
ncbi:MAG TPA: hypothetical protein VEJ63_06025 [Planctomycetota bacterium]|nr:hypothetical protein [Planctomycetota bacterium]